MLREIIAKKQKGKSLSSNEIQTFIDALTHERASAAQIGAWLMAVYFEGMTSEETTALTESMARSGEVLQWSDQLQPVVDKHSTGGVGDKTSLVLVPLLAACGLRVAKLSGKSLAHTGGTLDKLLCFPDIQLDLEPSEMKEILAAEGCFISGQTKEMVPADKILYHLRNETHTVESIPLISSSIMSKKIAGGASHILLDVKVGNGAILQDERLAKVLAEHLVRIGQLSGRQTRAVLSRMDQPLGFAIGNSLEVQEALQTLKGNGPEDLLTLCFGLGHTLLHMTGITQDFQESQSLMQRKIDSGEAYHKFSKMIVAQGGKFPGKEADLAEFPQATNQFPFRAKRQGYISKLPAKAIGQTVMSLANAPGRPFGIDLGAGILLHKKCGDMVEQGDVIGVVYGDDEQATQQVAATLERKIEIAPESPPKTPIIIQSIGNS